jgi:hypothetical protein
LTRRKAKVTALTDVANRIYQEASVDSSLGCLSSRSHPEAIQRDLESRGDSFGRLASTTPGNLDERTSIERRHDMQTRHFSMSCRPELHREVDFYCHRRVAGEAGGHVKDKPASGAEQLTEVDEGLATLVSRHRGEDIESDDAVKLLRRARKCTDSSGKAVVGDVRVKEMNLLIHATSRVDSKALLVKSPQDVGAEEALDSVDRNAEASSDLLLHTCDEATAASTKLENSFARLKVGQLECSLAIRTMNMASVFVAADHACKGVVDLGSRFEVDHHNGEVGGGIDWGLPLSAKKVE